MALGLRSSSPSPASAAEAIDGDRQRLELADSADLPRGPQSRVPLSNVPAVCQRMDRIRSQNIELAEQLPSHGERIAWLHRTTGRQGDPRS